MKATFKSIIVSILTWEARILLKRTKPKIVAVTGNVGKTSTKDAIYAALKGHVSARKSEKSFNSELGVPLSVLGLDNAWSDPILWIKNIFDGLLIALFEKNYPEVLVLEMGVDRPGDMALLTEWIKPDIVVLTRLPDVPVHVEYFDSPEEVVAEKLQLVEALQADGVLIYNHDDEKILQTAKTIRQQAIGYSRYSTSQWHATGDTIVYENGKPVGLEFDVTHLDKTARLRLNQSVGVPHVYAYLAAAAVAAQFDIDLPDSMASLREHIPTRGRMRLIPGLKDTVIIDDSYNSSPTAAERALLTLSEIEGNGRKIAVLGDMLELGQFSVREHERIGEMAAKTADILFTVGVRSRKVAEAALEYGLSEKDVYQYDDVLRAAAELQVLMQGGDTILVKGSQSIRTEKLVEEVMREPERAPELLVRQDNTWRSR